jgi:hypothetical protein
VGFRGAEEHYRLKGFAIDEPLDGDSPDGCPMWTARASHWGVRGKGFQGKAIAHPINFNDPKKTKGTAD